MEQNQSYLTTEKIGKLMGSYAVPCIISLFVGAFYNIIDQIFIANASYLGSFGNTANTVVFPLTVIALTIAVMIDDWLEQFDMFSIYEILPEILELWGENMAVDVQAKKGKAEANGK